MTMYKQYSHIADFIWSHFYLLFIQLSKIFLPSVYTNIDYIFKVNLNSNSLKGYLTCQCPFHTTVFGLFDDSYALFSFI